MVSLAAQTNAIPLPSVPEVFGVRLPSSPHLLTQVNFDLVPNKPPPTVKQYDEEIEEVEEEESEEEYEKQHNGASANTAMQGLSQAYGSYKTPSDADMASPAVAPPGGGDEGSEGGEEDDGLFAGGDDDSDADDAMESVEVPEVPNANGIKRKLVEEDDYD